MQEINTNTSRKAERILEIPSMMHMMFQKMVFPLNVLFVVADFLFYRPLFWQFLLLRLLTIPIYLLMTAVFDRVKTDRGVQLTAWCATVAIALIVNAVVWRAELESWGYYPGLILVMTASLSFLPFTFPFRISAIIAILGPYYIGFFVGHPNDLEILALNSFFFGSTALAAYYGNRFCESLRTKELLSRLALAEEIKSRDSIILAKTKEAVDLEISVREVKILGEMARNVSHDIRSPISALNLVVGSLKELPDSKKGLLLEAVKRVNDIANDLLVRSRKSHGSTNNLVSVNRQELAALIDQVLTEKRVQHVDEDIDFDVCSGAQSGVATVSLEPAKFKRIISNLINNSIEALVNDGKIEVELRQTSGHILVLVKDNGHGIPADILSKVMVEGFTYGKLGGNGLGLSTARREVESWGGSLEITSAHGLGTTVTIRLLIQT